jgi:hypothetical protein
MRARSVMGPEGGVADEFNLHLVCARVCVHTQSNGAPDCHVAYELDFVPVRTYSTHACMYVCHLSEMLPRCSSRICMHVCMYVRVCMSNNILHATSKEDAADELEQHPCVCVHACLHARAYVCVRVLYLCRYLVCTYACAYIYIVLDI